MSLVRLDIGEMHGLRVATITLNRPERANALVPAAVAAQTEAARGLKVALVDMNDQFCHTPRCDVRQNGLVMFTDDNHLTATFSRSLSQVFGARVEEAVEHLTR